MIWFRRYGFCIIAAAIWSAPAAAFDLSGVQVGRIWVPALDVPTTGVARTNRSVALMDFAECDHTERSPSLLGGRQRDCRFEQQLAEALRASGMFRRVVGANPLDEDIDFILVARRSRVAFQRRTISIVKPLLVVTLFTYLWTPLPYQVDLESYELALALLDRSGILLEEVSVDRQQTHYLGTYSSDHCPPADLLAAIDPATTTGSVTFCTGPHAASVVHELLQKVGEAVMRHSAPGS